MKIRDQLERLAVSGLSECQRANAAEAARDKAEQGLKITSETAQRDLARAEAAEEEVGRERKRREDAELDFEREYSEVARLRAALEDISRLHLYGTEGCDKNKHCGCAGCFARAALAPEVKP